MINDIYPPFISTIMSESLPYMIVQRDSINFEKLVLENNVNFYVYNSFEESSDGFVLRFDNESKWYNIEGFVSISISLDFEVEMERKLPLIIDLLDDGYVLLCNYNRYYIKELSYGKYMSHGIVIYGYDYENKAFYCLEYKKDKISKIRVSFDEIIFALSYYPWRDDKNGGLIAIKADNRTSNEFNYRKLFKHLDSYVTENLIYNHNGIEAYGQKAIEIFYHEIDYYRGEKERLYRCYYLVNYLRDSCKLMKERVVILDKFKNEMGRLKDRILLLEKEFDLIFLKLAMDRLNNNYEFYKLRMEDIYKLIIEYNFFVRDFRMVIKGVIETSSHTLHEFDLHINSKQYVRENENHIDLSRRRMLR